MKKIRLISFILCFFIAFSLTGAASRLSARAESATYTFDELISQNKVKTLGRTTPGLATAFWAGCGFEINIDTAGGDLTVGVVMTESRLLFEGFVDGVSLGRAPETTPEDPYIRFTGIPAGKHLIRIVRDSLTNKNGTAMLLFNDITFNGTVLEKPEDRDMYIEVIGASSTAGAGTLGVYEYGKTHKFEYHSITHSYGYYIANDLNADYSIVAAGGIGLYEVSEGKQEKYEGVPSTIQEVYEYTNGFTDLGTKENLYGFLRKPDLILVRIGGNDDTKNETKWKSLAVDFVKEIRKHNGNSVPVVWIETQTSAHYGSLFELSRTELKGDNFYVMPYKAMQGRGSAALPTQKSGHPDAEEHREFADAILAFLRERGLDKPIDHTNDDVSEQSVETTGQAPNEKAEDAATEKSNAIIYIIAAAITSAAAVCTTLAVKKRKSGDAGDEEKEQKGKKDEESGI